MSTKVTLLIVWVVPNNADGVEFTSTDATPIATPETSRPASPSTTQPHPRKAIPGGRLSRRARKTVVTSAVPAVSSGDESVTRATKSKGPSKKMRKWHAEGLEDEVGEVALDYSAPTGEKIRKDPHADSVTPGNIVMVDPSSWGKRTGKGDFVLKDLDEEMESILASSRSKGIDQNVPKGIVGSGFGALGEFFKSIVKGKTITKEDLEKPLKSMEDHLLNKNVAREAAVRLCSSVEHELIGVKTDSFSSKLIDI